MNAQEPPPNSSGESADSAHLNAPPADQEGIVDGERGIPSVNRIRSMQSRVTSVLAIGFVSLMALGFLAWYYTHEWQKTRVARNRAEGAAHQSTQGEMKLPPLGPLQPPQVKATSLWGTAPPAPPTPGAATPAMPLAYRPQSATARTEPPVDRRLTGPVLSEDGDSNANTRTSATASAVQTRSDTLLPGTTSGGSNGTGTLAGLLQPTSTPATFARALPTQRLLLPKGAFIDCTLETAIDSSLQGMVTCVTPTDIFSVDGTTVLLERGTKLTGETRGEARQGLARVFVLWTEARTPGGVVAALDSPGTDELGRSGLPGRIQRHFFERFGAAILVSVIEGAIQRAAQPGDGGTVILNPSTTGSVATEVLKSTVNIPPTILKHNGDRIQILVARDVDFRSVYELRPTAAR